MLPCIILQGASAVAHIGLAYRAMDHHWDWYD